MFKRFRELIREVTEVLTFDPRYELMKCQILRLIKEFEEERKKEEIVDVQAEEGDRGCY